MRFIKRAGRNIFRSARSVVRRIPKPLAIAGLTFFTAGLGTVGFGAFKTAAAAGGGLSGFLGAVGTTTVAGAQSLAAAVGIGSGISSGVATASGAAAGQTLATGAAAQALGLSAGPLGSSLQTLPLAGQTLAGGQTVSGAQSLGASSGVLSNFFSGVNQASGSDGGIGSLARQSMLMSGIQAGAQAYLHRSAEKREDQRAARLNFFGGPARGGRPELPFEVPSLAEPESFTDTATTPPSPSPSPRGPWDIGRTDFINEPNNQLFAQLNEEQEPFVPDFMRNFV